MDTWTFISPDFFDLGVIVQQGVAVMMGLSLAAVCGLRAFLPLLVISLLGMSGHVELGESFGWMASPVALICFLSAVIAEVAADKFPLVDHAMDSVGVLVKPTAAAIATASMVTGFDPLLTLVLGLLTGGVVAEAVHVAKAKARVASSALTGTVANPVLSVAEDGLALAGVALSVLLPAVAGLTVITAIALFFIWRHRRNSRSRALALA